MKTTIKFDKTQLVLPKGCSFSYDPNDDEGSVTAINEPEVTDALSRAIGDADIDYRSKTECESGLTITYKFYIPRNCKVSVRVV